MKVSYVASFEKVMIFNHFDGTFTTYPYVIEVTKLRWKEKENFQDKNSSKIYAKQLINYSMKINVWRKNWECQLLCLQVHEPQKKKYWRWYNLIFFCEIAQLLTRCTLSYLIIVEYWISIEVHIFLNLNKGRVCNNHRGVNFLQFPPLFGAWKPQFGIILTKTYFLVIIE